MCLHKVLDSIAVSVFVVILVEFDKSETSRLVYKVCPERRIVAVIAFVWLFTTVYFQMLVKIVFLNVSSNCLLEGMHCHTG